MSTLRRRAAADAPEATLPALVESNQLDEPVVSVGLPTRNRVTRLERALTSIEAQDMPSIEVIVGDNASDDGTEAVCQPRAARDRSFHYLRSEVDRGATANFISVLGGASGDYFMWLGDDDWLEPGYLRACADLLSREPSIAVAVGRVDYHAGSDAVRSGVAHQITESDPEARVRHFFRTVADNGAFYGLMRMSMLRRILVPENTMGADWLLMANLAFQGKIVSLQDVSVNRDVGGKTRSLRNVARSSGFSWFEAEVPQVAIAGFIVRDIAWRSPVYSELGRIRRIRLALTCAAIIVRRFVIPNIPRYLRSLPRRVRGAKEPESMEAAT